MKKFVVFLALFALVKASDPGKTPVETEDGEVLLENCLLRDELNENVRAIGENMRAFGISHPTTTAYSTWVLNEAASAAKASEEVVCITPRNVKEVGVRLGDIIWDFMKEDGPTKRRGERPQFDFDAERDEDNTVAKPGKCCKCPQNEFPRWDKGEWRRKCWRGPCCPELCRSLNRLQVSASEGVLECCNRNYRPCLHNRGNSQGQRGNNHKGQSSKFT